MSLRFVFLGLAACLVSFVTNADPKVYSPYVDKGEFALEVRGNTTIDDDDAEDGKQRHVFEVEYSVTDWWQTAFVGRLDKPGDGSLRYLNTAWENLFQLTEPGEYWVDAGLYFEYKLADESGVADVFEAKLLLEKPVQRFDNTLNLIFEKEVGAHSEESVEFGYAWRTKTELAHEMGVGFEAFGELGEIQNTASLEDQEHQLGPVFYHEVEAGGLEIEYNLAWLFGLTEASPDNAFRWEVEFEF